MSRLRWLLLCLITGQLFLLGPLPAYADLPPPPHAFFGNLTINNNPAPVGTEVKAIGDGVITGIRGNPIITTQVGKYGSPDGSTEDLYVQGGNITAGTLLRFYVNGVDTNKTCSYQSGEMNRLDLAVTISTTTASTTPPAAAITTTPTATTTTTPIATSPTTPAAATTTAPAAVSPTSATSSSGQALLTDKINSQGIITQPVTAASVDGICRLTIDSGTKAVSREGKPLTQVTITPLLQPPALPNDAHIIGETYELGPDGATFSTPVVLRYSYNPANIPGGINEKNLTLAYYDKDAGNWVGLPSAVDTVTKTITALTSHFTSFAILGKATTPSAPTSSPVRTPSASRTASPSPVFWAIAGGLGGVIAASLIVIIVLLLRRRK